MLSMLLVTALTLCNYACESEDELVHPKPRQEDVSTNSHALSQEQAMASLQDFMESFDGGTTRSAMHRRVKEVFPVEYYKDVTRAGADTVDCENLLYVVNFEDDQGYAILAADDRIKDAVLAVIEHGNMSVATMRAASGSANMNFRPIFSGFPTTGPGYISSEQHPDEIFMNPNTVDLRDSIEGDTLVGNFDPCGLTVTEPTTPDFTPNPSREPVIDINGELIGGFVYDKARNDLYDENVANGENITPKPEGDGGSMEISYGGWKLVSLVPPLLDAFWEWDQHAPFNNLYPSCFQFWGNGVKSHADAGCVPLALAKVMTYLEQPKRYTYERHTIDWGVLKKTAMTDEGKSHAAMLLYQISRDCHSIYFYNGTFTFPFQAKRFLANHGYTNVHKRNYSFERVSSMISKKHPVIMFSMPRFHITKSHCWNVDGYKILKRDITYKYYDSKKNLVRTDCYVDIHNMVHCDFGWGGLHNGYYTSGVFKLNDQDAEYDHPEIGNNRKTHYNNYKRILSYD